MKSLTFLSFLVFLSFSNKVFAQVVTGLEQSYRSNIPFDQDVVSGGYFVDPPKEFEGHPYLITKNFELSEITINGLTYSDVPILYNIWKDQVLTFQPIHKQKILIRSDKINAFTLRLESPLSFVRLPNNPSYSHHGSGIYEYVGDGPSRVLIKHRKLTKPKREYSIYSEVFYETQDYFLQKNAEILKVSNKKQAIDFLGLENKEVRKLTKASNLDYRTDRKGYLHFLVSLYNQEQNEKK
ncbi:hypothetical protein [Cecembia calidifontis]|jgi:hypothetical protein|uniref:Uncharacterized protein n=1 Tax=Cecembia calidifontis TaxID=1187080 RepID=A0A4Q7PE88_9BACT|nr:hypothetical protein [Cecembia calidifontis]RZS98726.1 hypothetical protein BC751_4393 [Cecembia calidifontis]